MKKTILLCIFLLSTFIIGAQVPHPTAWLRADSAVLNAPSWHDVSGNGLDATPSSGSMPAAFSRMNFNKCFEVGGAETFTLPLGINGSRQSDVVVVYETYDTADENALWQIRIDTARRIGQTTRRILNDNGQITYDTANRLKPVVNYLAQSWRMPEICAPTLTLCTADSLPLNGRIAEALYFDHRISDTAVIQWISYLAVKYGVTLAQTDYLDSRRNVIWDYTHYPGYCASIAGIGRDDSTGLYQKQTYYADGHIIIGIAEPPYYGGSTLTENNEDNPAFIADGDFILFGCRDAMHCVSTVYAQDGSIYEAIGRSMAQVTGDAHTYGTFVLLDTAAGKTERAPSLQYAPILLIDRSGTGEFPAGETEQVQSIGTDTLGHYVYGNVHWDTDRSGRDFFCFAVAMPDTTGTPKALAVNGDGDTGNSPSATPRYRLSPNPNHGNFTVEITYPEAQDVVVTVHDSDGRLLLTMGGKGQSAYRFGNSVPAAGHYLIDITSPSEHKILKMVVN